METAGTKANNRTLIRKISTKRLFGFHTYNIDVPDSPAGEANLLILYGDNGSGKTTLLKILFHLLSYEPFKGHRSFIRSVRFEEICVHLDNDLLVRAFRDSQNLNGDYQLEIKEKGRSLVVCNPGTKSDRNEPNYLNYCKILQKHNIVFYYLGDNRTLEKNVGDDQSSLTNLIVDADMIAERFLTHRDIEVEQFRQHLARGRRPSTTSVLDETIQSAVDWIRQQALHASDTGTLQANSVYAEVISRVVNVGEVHTDYMHQEIKELLADISSLANWSREYSRFGLQPEFDGKRLTETINRAHSVSEQLIIQRILKPYIDGIRVRLEALAEVQKLIQRFVSHLNDFYRDKRCSFDLQGGLSIVSTRTDDKLSPNTLSSGEQQLLLLLCNALTAREHAGIFIIDEPEISLNVKWQRKLITALLDCMRGSKGLFVVASHSIELITPYKRHVQALTDVEE